MRRASEVELGPWRPEEQPTDGWGVLPFFCLNVGLGVSYLVARATLPLERWPWPVCVGIAITATMMVSATLTARPGVPEPLSIERPGVRLVERALIRWTDVRGVRLVRGWYLFLDLRGHPLFSVSGAHPSAARELAHAVRHGIDGLGPSVDLPKLQPIHAIPFPRLLVSQLVLGLWLLLASLPQVWVAWPIALALPAFVGVRLARALGHPEREISLAPEGTFRDVAA